MEGEWCFELKPVADPDLELRGEEWGGGGFRLIYLPCWLFSLRSFPLFLTQNKGGPPCFLSLMIVDSLILGVSHLR